MCNFFSFYFRVPVISRNTYQITFQVVELAVALWFPCCLWNCIKPETLWLLNPRRILKKVKNKKTNQDDESTQLDNLMLKNNHNLNEQQGKLECWICYDNDKNDILIQPCKCKGMCVFKFKLKFKLIFINNFFFNFN